MTTFQDPPPQSRRAVRQSERGDADQVPYPSFTPPAQVPDQSQREMWDTMQRRAAQLPQPPAPPVSGRRSAAPAPTEAEPLTYTTQGRSPVPAYDGPFRNEPAELPPTQAIPAQEQPTYRVRDYAPAAFAPAPTWTSEPVAPSDLDYQTEARIAAAQPAQPAPVQPAPAEPVSQTLTRRELRAMLQSEQAAELPPMPVDAAPAQPVAAPLDPTEEKPWPFAFGGEAPAQAPPVAAQPAAASVPQAPAAYQPVEQLAPPTPADGARALFGDLMTPLDRPLAVAPEPEPNTALTNAMAEYDALAAAQAPAPIAPAPAAPVAPPQPVVAPMTTPEPALQDPARQDPSLEDRARSRPVGHWSTQADLDDETQPYESTINRKVSSGHATTNALVLPITPERDIRGALTGTGEIMLTGSIDLPASLGSSGTTDRHDHVGLDSLFDANDHELTPTDSQPVRAVRAVSTHQTGQAVTHTQKPKGNRVLTVLLFAAVGMAVVGVGLLVAVVLMNVL